MAKKNLKGGPLVSSSFHVTLKKEQLLMSSSLGQKVQFGVSSKFRRTFGRTILVTSGGSKNKTGTSKVGAISKAQKTQSF